MFSKFENELALVVPAEDTSIRVGYNERLQFLPLTEGAVLDVRPWYKNEKLTLTVKSITGFEAEGMRLKKVVLQSSGGGAFAASVHLGRTDV